MSVEIKKSVALALFNHYGWNKEHTSNWSDERIQRYLPRIKEVVDDQEAPEDEELSKALIDILAAVEDEIELVLVADKTTEPKKETKAETKKEEPKKKKRERIPKEKLKEEEPPVEEQEEEQEEKEPETEFPSGGVLKGMEDKMPPVVEEPVEKKKRGRPKKVSIEEQLKQSQEEMKTFNPETDTELVPPKAKKHGTGVRKGAKGRGYYAGQVVKRFGLDKGITDEMVEVLDGLYGRANEKASRFALAWAHATIRGFFEKD